MRQTGFASNDFFPITDVVPQKHGMRNQLPPTLNVVLTPSRRQAKIPYSAGLLKCTTVKPI